MKIDEKDTSKEPHIKKCFIITPIGSSTSEIRRHIDGVIHSAIEPVLNELNYTLSVSHEVKESGSIKKEIIRDIYFSDLVIANLTEKNPNVMYEVALRHAIKKPIIHITENLSELPFDINDHRTIEYKNDMEGVVELKKELKKMIQVIERNPDEISNPIIDALTTLKIVEPKEEETTYDQMIHFMYSKMNDMQEQVLDIKTMLLSDKINYTLKENDRLLLEFNKQMSKDCSENRLEIMIESESFIDQFEHHKEFRDNFQKDFEMEIGSAFRKEIDYIKFKLRKNHLYISLIDYTMQFNESSCIVAREVVKKVMDRNDVNVVYSLKVNTTK